MKRKEAVSHSKQAFTIKRYYYDVFCSLSYRSAALLSSIPMATPLIEAD